MAKAKQFFNEQSEQSAVKAAIVAKYFWAWAKVMVANAKRFGDGKGKIAYLDLFAGPGRYDDNSKSTPVLVLETALKDADMRARLVTIFNDLDAENCSSLTNAIAAIPGIDQLAHSPKVHNHEVGTKMVEEFEGMKLIPTLFFVDPWGYKALSLRLVNSVLKDWGCDAIFFFNYNRVSMGLTNELVRTHMNALFGEARAETLRARVEGASPADRELMIVEEITAALKEQGGQYVLPFAFFNEEASRTSHHLIFVSKHRLGYDIMKGIMAAEFKA